MESSNRGARRAGLGTALAVACLVAMPPGARAQATAGGEAKTHWTNSDPAGRGGGPVSAAALTASPRSAAEWLHYGGNYASWRHSPVDTLTPETVGELRMAWAFQTGKPGQLEVNPVLYDGILYVTSAYNRLFALDATSGALIWRYDHPQPEDLRICCGPANRGVAITGDTVLMATLDARLVAFDRKSGEVRWNAEIIDYRGGFSATSAPLVVGDLAVIGVGGGDFGARCFIDAYDVATGERRWRHYTVPDAGEPGVETWAGDSYKRGGASTWSVGSYDPEADVLFWSTGNPSPDWNGDVRKGDNLYSDSILALDPATGERKWYFQTTPHDVWDYDGNNELFLLDVEWEGRPVQAIAQANRNGYFYLLDRTTGKFLRGTQYVKELNWATLDENGRPIVDPDKTPRPKSEKPSRVCPGIAGGNNASYAGAFSPLTRLAYIPTIESCMQIEKEEAIYARGIPYFAGWFTSTDREGNQAHGDLVAIDVDTGEVRWRHNERYPMMAGALSTAGGVVFTGTADGYAVGVDAKTGAELWRFATGSGVRSQPMAYQLDGKTYLAIGSGGGGLVQEIVGMPTPLPHGSTLFVFALPDE